MPLGRPSGGSTELRKKTFQAVKNLVGLFCFGSNFTQALADSATWPTTGDSVDVRWKIRRYYNWNYFGGGTVSFDYGHVGKEEINTDNDTAPEIIYLYRYDEFGNVTAVQNTIDGITRTVP